MFGLHIADVFVLGLYLVGITAIGIWAARRIKTIADFFMPRRFGKVMMITHAFGTGTHSDQAVSVASKSFTNGLSGIWYQWLWLFATPFYWLSAPVMRRFRAITTADVFEARFGPSVAMLFAIVGIVVSLFSRPVAKKKLENFYALVRTPIQRGEQVAVPCTLPADAVVPERRNLFPGTSLEIAIPSRTSVVGFLVGWGCVAAIIYSVYLIAVG